jgi:HD-GYP domain-containing protein (c-di-GMP phosphodiesterase class II)
VQEHPALFTPIFDLVLCLSQAIDLVSPLVANHHKRTALIAYGLGMQMKLPEAEMRHLVTAAALHDVGSLTLKERLVTLDFEFQDPLGHSVLGYLLLKTFPPFETAADMVRFHHVPWQHGAGAVFHGLPVPLGSQILHLADRLAVLIDPALNILDQVDGVLGKIRALSGEVFDPDLVQALEALAEKESFWLDIIYIQSLTTLNRRLNWEKIKITEDDFLGLTNLFRRIIDFRSRFTASHSAGVAAVAEQLACLCNFSEYDCLMIHLAGLLHDLGKLAVPAEILEKNGSLTKEEYDAIRRHTYYTFYILEPLKILDIVRVWGSLHHERMDGHGYPFHLQEDELPLGSRIVSVADIFTALTEARPYRQAVSPQEALQMLLEASNSHHIDQQVVAVLQAHLAEVDQARRQAQVLAEEEYQQFSETARQLINT